MIGKVFPIITLAVPVFTSTSAYGGGADAYGFILRAILAAIG